MRLFFILPLLPVSLSRSRRLSSALSVSLRSLWCTRTGGGQADKSQSDTFLTGSHHLLSDPALLETHLHCYLCIYVDHTISMYICGCITVSRDISATSELFTQRQLCLEPATPGEQFQVISSSPCLGHFHPLFFLSSPLLSTFFPLSAQCHSTQGTAHNTHADAPNSCRGDRRQHTHHAAVSHIAFAG